MNSKSLTFLGICFLLAVAVGCGREQKVSELIRLGDDAQKHEYYGDAINDYTAAIQLDPKSNEAYIQRGTVFTMTGEFGKAISDLNEAIRLKPGQAYAYEMIGYAHFGNDEIGQAISNYNQALEIEPDNPRVLGMRGKAYYWKKDYTNAVADLTAALKSTTNDPEIYDDRGGAYYSEKAVDQALNDFNEAIRLNPEDAFARFDRSRIFDQRGQYVEAVSDLKIVVRLKPRAAHADNLLAWLLATCPVDQLRDGKTAEELAMKACEVSKWEKYAYVDTLAAAYAETGDFENAVKYQKQAVSMDGIPEDKRTNMQNRVELYLQQKPYRGSKTDYY